MPAQVAKIEDLPVPPLSPSDLIASKTPDVSGAQKAQEERLVELNKKIEALQKSSDEANKKMPNFWQKVESATKDPVVSANRLPNEAALQEKIARLESQLAAQSKKTEALKTVATSETVAEEFVAKPKAKTVAKKKPAAKVAKKTEAKPAEVQQAWVLRAATPDAAQFLQAVRQAS